MTSDRDRLIELIKKALVKWENLRNDFLDEKIDDIDPFRDVLADYLLANGVIVPPCKVGDKVYQVIGNIMSEYKVTQIRFDDIMMWFYCENEEYVNEYEHFLFDETRIGKTVFLTKEEAEEKLKELNKGE